MSKKIKPAQRGAAIVPRADLSPTNVGRIAQVFTNVDLRNGHDGLMEIAKKRGVDFAKLEPGHYIVFMNEQKDRFKIFAPSPNKRGAIVAYYKSYNGRVDRESMETLPQAFGVKRKFETNEKMAEKLDEALSYKRIRTVSED